MGRVFVTFMCASEDVLSAMESFAGHADNPPAAGPVDHGSKC